MLVYASEGKLMCIIHTFTFMQVLSYYCVLISSISRPLDLQTLCAKSIRDNILNYRLEDIRLLPYIYGEMLGKLSFNCCYFIYDINFL